MENGLREKATRFLEQLASSNFDVVRTMCTDTATVWHNDGNGEQLMDEKMEQLASISSSVGPLEYEVIRRFERADEVLQQQTLRSTGIDGSHVEFHAMMYFRFRGGLIDRIEEYGYAMPEPASGGWRS